MQIHLPPTITREADHIRFELSTRVERWLGNLFPLFMAGLMPLSLLDPKTDLGSTLVLAALFALPWFFFWRFITKSHGVVLRLYPKHLVVERKGKESDRVAWIEVIQIEDAFFFSKGFRAMLLQGRDGNLLCSIPNGGSVPYLGDTISAFLPQDLQWRRRQRPARLEGLSILAVKSLLGCGVGIGLVIYSIGLVRSMAEAVTYDPGLFRMALVLLLLAFVVLGYGMLAIAKIITRPTYLAMEEFKVSYPYREGKVIVDLLRLAFGMGVQSPRVYVYSETFKKVGNRSRVADYASVGLVVLIATGFAVTAIWDVTHSPGSQNAGVTVAFALTVWMFFCGLFVAFPLAFERNLRAVLSRKEDVFVFDGQLKINGVVPDEVFWPRITPNMSDAKTKINLTTSKVMINGETRLYDFGSMVWVPDEGPT